MEYQLVEIREAEKAAKTSKNAGGKARADAAQILTAKGVQTCELPLHELERTASKGIRRLFWHRRAIKELDRCFSQVSRGDTIYLQFPIYMHSIFLGSYFRRLIRRGIHIVLLIHDLESLRWAKTRRRLRSRFLLWAEEVLALRSCSCIIVHNDNMKAVLTTRGIPEEKLVSLGAFDYLVPHNTPFEQGRFLKDSAVIIAGNLAKKKSAYVYDLPPEIHWNLYGAGYESGKHDNITYYGAFTPEELPVHLEGSFGLVWDGFSPATCTGVPGEYLKINNPHKTSLYLASGLPVIVWKDAAIAAFVAKHGAGFSVSSLYEVQDVIRQLSDTQYETMKENAKHIGVSLRNGDFLTEAIQEIRRRLNNMQERK